MDPDETFIWDPDFPDLLNSRCRHKVYKNMDLGSKNSTFNANLGIDQNKWNGYIYRLRRQMPSACVGCR